MDTFGSWKTLLGPNKNNFHFVVHIKILVVREFVISPVDRFRKSQEIKPKI